MDQTGLIFDIKRFSVNDGPGIRTTVFFKGCPLTCWWCHNPESRLCDIENMSVTRKLDGKEYKTSLTVGKYISVKELLTEIEKDRVFYETSGGGVTFSGGEPLFQPVFLISLLEECHLRDINICLDTSGYSDSDLFSEIISKIDMCLFDIKTLDIEEHIKYTGVANDIILTNLNILSASGKPFIIRIPVIPGVNNNTENMEKMRLFIERLSNPAKEVHLLPYHPFGRNKFKRMGMEEKMEYLDNTVNAEIANFASEFEQKGYTVKIGG